MTKVNYTDYDPWGMILNGRSNNFGFADDKYKFTGKERDTETGYLHFGARAYDGRIGRWNVVDPLAEKYPGWNPYNYCLNNPLKFVDKEGNEPGDLTKKKREFYSSVGNMIVSNAIKLGIAKEQAIYMVTQRLQENGWGTSVPGNNLFNIKGTGDAGSLKLTTKEEDQNGKSTTVKANFRAYQNPESAIKDYLKVLQDNFPQAYNALVNGEGIEEFTSGLQNGSLGQYATDADYETQIKNLYKQVSEEYIRFEEEQKKNNSGDKQ